MTIMLWNIDDYYALEYWWLLCSGILMTIIKLMDAFADFLISCHSVDSFKKQINEMNAELSRYKLMLAVAERDLDEK